MKRVLLTISVLVMIATVSVSAHAKASGFWHFMETFFTGKGLDSNCADINSSDPLKEAAAIGSMKGDWSSITVGADGSTTWVK